MQRLRSLVARFPALRTLEASADAEDVDALCQIMQQVGHAVASHGRGLHAGEL